MKHPVLPTRIGVLSALLLYGFFVSTQLVTAAPSAVDEDAMVKEVSASVFSPFCPGRTLEDCPSTAASELKQKLRLKVREGATEEDLLVFLYGLYGDQIRALPSVAGFGAVAWFGPLVFLLLGTGLVYLWLRSRHAVQGPAAEVVVSATARARVERELAGDQSNVKPTTPR